jgi:hypothetical protein
MTIEERQCLLQLLTDLRDTPGKRDSLINRAQSDAPSEGFRRVLWELGEIPRNRLSDTVERLWREERETMIRSHNRKRDKRFLRTLDLDW